MSARGMILSHCRTSPKPPPPFPSGVRSFRKRALTLAVVASYASAAEANRLEPAPSLPATRSRLPRMPFAVTVGQVPCSLGKRLKTFAVAARYAFAASTNACRRDRRQGASQPGQKCFNIRRDRRPGALHPGQKCFNIRHDRARRLLPGTRLQRNLRNSLTASGVNQI